MDFFAQCRDIRFAVDATTALENPNKVCLQATKRLLVLLSVPHQHLATALQQGPSLLNNARSLTSTIAMGVNKDDHAQLAVYWQRFAHHCQTDSNFDSPELLVAKADFEDVLRDLRTKFAMQLIDSSAFAASCQLKEVPVSDKDACRLLSVDQTTWYQWQTYHPEVKPSERLAAIAKAIYFILPGLTADGVPVWFDRPRYQLGGQTPLERVAAGDGTAVVSLASEGRFQTAT